MENKQHSDLEISNSMQFFIWRTTAADAVGRPPGEVTCHTGQHHDNAVGVWLNNVTHTEQ